MCVDICLNSSLSLNELQQLGAYAHSRLRFPQRWHGVSPLHLIFLRLHSLHAILMYLLPEISKRGQSLVVWHFVDKRLTYASRVV
jgi:ABC-type maltose transport system permease subunit